MVQPNIIDIQKFSVFDGDGIRTTVFFKGCHLNCWWCHNPESQSFRKEVLHNKEKCVGCGACIEVCPQKAISRNKETVIVDRTLCVGCGTCTDYCIQNALEVSGEQHTAKELFKLIEKDRMFYENSTGGVTLSGGEVMVQNMDYIEELLKLLKKAEYHVAVDTCGYAPTENYERIAPYVDVFLYDLKFIDEEKHIKYMGKGNELIFKNLEFLNSVNANINARLPIIEGVNNTDKDIQDIIDYLKEKQISVFQVNLLPYHDIGKHKYDKLDLEYKGVDFKVPSPERMEELKQRFIDAGFTNTKIGG